MNKWAISSFLSYFPVCGLYTFQDQRTPIKQPIKDNFQSLADFLFQMKQNAQVYEK